jgi:hypothetical protein
MPKNAGVIKGNHEDEGEEGIESQEPIEEKEEMD